MELLLNYPFICVVPSYQGPITSAYPGLASNMSEVGALNFSFHAALSLSSRSKGSLETRRWRREGNRSIKKRGEPQEPIKRFTCWNSKPHGLLSQQGHMLDLSSHLERSTPHRHALIYGTSVGSQ